MKLTCECWLNAFNTLSIKMHFKLKVASNVFELHDSITWVLVLSNTDFHILLFYA